MCRRFDDQLGPTGRRLIYVHMLGQRTLALSFNNGGVPAWEDRLLRLTWPLAAAYACPWVSTVPPDLLIASTALSGVTFSTIKNKAEVPG